MKSVWQSLLAVFYVRMDIYNLRQQEAWIPYRERDIYFSPFGGYVYIGDMYITYAQAGIGRSAPAHRGGHVQNRSRRRERRIPATGP